MEVIRRVQQLEGRTLVLELPESFANQRVEVVVSAVQPAQTYRRPHPTLLGKTKILGDLFDSAPGSAWALP